MLASDGVRLLCRALGLPDPCSLEAPSCIMSKEAGKPRLDYDEEGNRPRIYALPAIQSGLRRTLALQK